MSQSNPSNALASIPSVDRLLRSPAVSALVAEFGRELVTGVTRESVSAYRAALAKRARAPGREDAEREIAERIEARLRSLLESTLSPVLNLTGTVLHTNLGRAPMPEEAVRAMTAVAANPVNLEIDLETGRRGDRDVHVERWLCRLTGAEAATVVNNNAAAVLLTLNTLAARKRVPVSRGELIEIGGAFRMPDIMARAGCKLVEVGTTNRTHLKDYAGAIDGRTALVMKVHTSNYVIQGFTASVPERDLVRLAHEHDLPFVNDLGSGTLVDLTRFGLPPEPTPMESLANGADLVTFSGDKLLGGPQCGLIVGRRDLVARLKRNPMKRAMRIDKVTMAGLDAVLRLYADPQRLAERVPAIRQLSRPGADIAAMAERLAPAVAERLRGVAEVSVVGCESQVGSGSMPIAELPSAALALRPVAKRMKPGTAAARLAAALRRLPVPVLGRIHEDTLLLDLRCLDHDDALLGPLSHLAHEHPAC